MDKAKVIKIGKVFHPIPLKTKQMFTCHPCNYQFEEENNFKKHNEQHHLVQNKKVEKPIDDTSQNNTIKGNQLSFK